MTWKRTLKYACCLTTVLVPFLLLKFCYTTFVMYQATYIIPQPIRFCNKCTQNVNIPRILHRTWKDKNIPTRWEGTYKSCLRMYKNFTHMFWTDDDIEKFLEKEYSWFMLTFRSYSYNIQRVDAARYFILYHYGGIYLDLDVGCKEPIFPVLEDSQRYNVLLTATYPTGVSNDIIVTEKGHPLLEGAIQRLAAANSWYGTPFVTIMWSTGPIFLTKCLKLYTETSYTQDVYIIPVEGSHKYFK